MFIAQWPPSEPDPVTVEADPWVDDDSFFDDCECGWSSGHRDLCTCGSLAAEDAGQSVDPCDCATCRAIALDRLARLVERPVVTPELRPGLL